MLCILFVSNFDIEMIIIMKTLLFSVKTPTCCQNKMEYNDNGSVKDLFVLTNSGNVTIDSGCPDGCVYVK